MYCGYHRAINKENLFKFDVNGYTQRALLTEPIHSKSRVNQQEFLNLASDAVVAQPPANKTVMKSLINDTDFSMDL